MENEKKFCPMNPSRDEVLLCVREKCAWWNYYAQECAVSAMAGSLVSVSGTMKRKG